VAGDAVGGFLFACGCVRCGVGGKGKGEECSEEYPPPRPSPKGEGEKRNPKGEGEIRSPKGEGDTNHFL
jgi:hypothetical protein